MDNQIFDHIYKIPDEVVEAFATGGELITPAAIQEMTQKHFANKQGKVLLLPFFNIKYPHRFSEASKKIFKTIVRASDKKTFLAELAAEEQLEVYLQAQEQIYRLHYSMLPTSQELTYEEIQGCFELVQHGNEIALLAEIAVHTEKIRHEITMALQALNFEVEIIPQDPSILFNLGLSKKWYRLANTKELVAKIKPAPGQNGRKPILTPNHPYIVKEEIYFVGDHSVTIAPDLTGVPSFEDLFPSLSSAERLDILLEALKGLAFYHDQNQSSHLDVSEANVMVKKSGHDLEAKIGDFENARPFKDSFPRLYQRPGYNETTLGVLANYCSNGPEADLFAVGVMILNSIAGKYLATLFCKNILPRLSEYFDMQRHGDSKKKDMHEIFQQDWVQAIVEKKLRERCKAVYGDGTFLSIVLGPTAIYWYDIFVALAENITSNKDIFTIRKNPKKFFTELLQNLDEMYSPVDGSIILEKPSYEELADTIDMKSAQSILETLHECMLGTTYDGLRYYRAASDITHNILAQKRTAEFDSFVKNIIRRELIPPGLSPQVVDAVVHTLALDIEQRPPLGELIAVLEQHRENIIICSMP